MKRVRWADAATRDLRKIELRLQGYDEAVAQEHVDRIVLATYLLLENPRGGPRAGKRGRRKWTPPGQQIAVIVYRVTRDGIEIMRVEHTRSDWRRSV